jgi:predicted membrane protein
MARRAQENRVSDDKEFDGKKFSDNLRDQIHRDIHGRVHVGIGILGKDGVRPLPMHWGLFSGGIIALIGLLILLDNLGFHVLSHVFRFWPMILILVGAWNLTCKSGRVFGGVLVLLGLLFQLDTLGVAHFSWGEMWPLAIIGVGFLVMWSSLQARKISKVVSDALGGESQADPRTTLNEVAIFGGIERRITSQDFQGGTINAVFGSVELDLRDVNIQQEDAILEINSVFGSVELRVPDAWQITSRGQAVFGSFQDDTRNYRNENPANPLRKSLILTGAAVFGSVEIKN